MTVKTANELAAMRRGGRILARVLEKLMARARPGVTLLELEQLAAKLIREAGAKPAFKGYLGYKFATCLSLNEEVVHGLPRLATLKEGDLLGIDIGILYQGFYTDSAATVGIGKISEEERHLLEVTYRSLVAGIKSVKPGIRLGDVQTVIQEEIEQAGLTVVRDLCGHGIGRRLQEDPQIPNFGRPGEGPLLEQGLTLALEPMVSLGSAHVATRPDGWTAATLDGTKAAHFEHTVAVTPDGFEVLTERQGEKIGQKDT